MLCVCVCARVRERACACAGAAVFFVFCTAQVAWHDASKVCLLHKSLQGRSTAGGLCHLTRAGPCRMLKKGSEREHRQLFSMHVSRTDQLFMRVSRGPPAMPQSSCCAAEDLANYSRAFLAVGLTRAFLSWALLAWAADGLRSASPQPALRTCSAALKIYLAAHATQAAPRLGREQAKEKEYQRQGGRQPGQTIGP